MMPMTIMPAITTAVASDVAALVIITPRPALAPMYSAATTAIQPIAAAARAALAIVGRRGAQVDVERERRAAHAEHGADAGERRIDRASSTAPSTPP